MLDKLAALFGGKTTTRLVLAGVAIAWGVQTITDTIRGLEARHDELCELIALRELQLAELGDDEDDEPITFEKLNHPAYQFAPTVKPSPFINHDTHDIDIAGHDESVAAFLDSRDHYEATR